MESHLRAAVQTSVDQHVDFVNMNEEGFVGPVDELTVVHERPMIYQLRHLIPYLQEHYFPEMRGVFTRDGSTILNDFTVIAPDGSENKHYAHRWGRSQTDESS